MNRRFSHILRAVSFFTAIAVLTAACILCPKQTHSASERRPLAAFPTLTVSSLMNGSFTAALETYTVDHFPFRDRWRSLKACVAQGIYRQQDLNGLYEYNGSVCDMEYPLDADSISRACKLFGSIYDKYLAEHNSRAWVTVVPDKNAFFAEPSGHLSMDYAAFYDQVASQMPFAQYIPIDHLLSADSYFTNDTHWKQEELLPVAQAIAEATNTEWSTEHTVRPHSEPFYGVYSGQYALPLPADKLCTVHSDTIDAMTVFDMEHQKEIPLYDTARLASDDPYELFVGGSLSLVRIDNPTVQTDRELIVFRDSFASSIAPLLAEGYRSVTLVDIRYLSHTQLSRYLDFHGQDVLFLYSTSTLNHSQSFK